MTPPAVITTARAPRKSWGPVRGAWAVAVLLLSALDHLVTAVIGWRPVAVTVRRFAAPVAAAWRSAVRCPAPGRISPAATFYVVTTPAPERTHDDGNPAD